GDLTGFAVSNAGNFDNDGFEDFLIGSPGFNLGAGRATLIYGRAARINGTFPVSAPPGPFAEFLGAQAGALAGYSLSATGRINSDPFNEILIGSPGFNNLSGAAYLIPGRAGLLTGQQSLDSVAVMQAPV